MGNLAGSGAAYFRAGSSKKAAHTHTHSVWDLVQAHMPAGDLLMLHQKGAGLLQLWSFVEQDLRKMSHSSMGLRSPLESWV